MSLEVHPSPVSSTKASPLLLTFRVLSTDLYSSFGALGLRDSCIKMDSCIKINIEATGLVLLWIPVLDQIEISRGSWCNVLLIYHM